MKVLVVDDEEDVRFIANASLGRVGGMVVIEASSGPEGVARARSERPDFILLDLMMPGMDGAATFRELKASKDTADIPVVFLTARAMTEISSLTALGAKGVVRKPFDPMTLSEELQRILAR